LKVPENSSLASTVLVTGGAGYLGCMLVPRLIELGYHVRVLDKLFFGEQGLAPYLERIDLVRGDIRRPPTGIFKGVTAVINLAGLSAEPAAEYNPEANRSMNTEGLRILATEAKKHGVRRLIQASSGSIYDVGGGNPEKDFLQDESTPVSPFRVYSITKREAEEILLALGDKGFCPVILRKGSIYGYSPRMRFDLVVNAFVRNAMTRGFLELHCGGETWRPILGIKDAVEAYITVLRADESQVRGEIFNIVTENVRISELALRVRKTLADLEIASDIRADYEPRKLRSCQASGRRFRETFGFQFRFSVEDGVRELVDKIRTQAFPDIDHPRYRNIQWMDILEETYRLTGGEGSVTDLEPVALAGGLVR
jgi:nucleoside-diphosphate-sugar epimerase